MPPPPPKTSRLSQLVRQRERVKKFLRTEIWRPTDSSDGRRRQWGILLLRIISITRDGLRDLQIANRAAALSFSSLLALGPVIALIFMFAGFMIERTGSEIAVQSINRAILFVAPQISMVEEQDSRPAETSAEEEDSARDESANANGEENGGPNGEETLASGTIELNPELVELINTFISSSQSGAVGLVGSLILILVAMQMMTSVENTFNAIWGVNRGRSWFLRIVFYWTNITLGAVLVFAALGLLSTLTLTSFGGLPYGGYLARFINWATPFLLFLMLVVLLAAFYRFMPNTNVRWGPALLGGFFVSILLLSNNALAIFYVQRVITSYNLYGSVGILPVIMIGLFVFWIFILLGAQITYAVQNVNYLSNQEMWKRISFRTRELLSLLVLLKVARRFHHGGEPYSAAELIDELKAPSQIVNECLTQLSAMSYLTCIPPSGESTALIYRYQPARPLRRMTLGQFHRDLAEFGNSEASILLHDLDEVVTVFQEKIDGLDPSFDQTLEEILHNEDGKKG